MSSSEYSTRPARPWEHLEGEYRGPVGRERVRKNKRLVLLSHLDEALQMPAALELQIWTARAPEPLPNSPSRERLQIRVVDLDRDETFYPFPVEISTKRLLAQMNALISLCRTFGLTWDALMLSTHNNGGSFYAHFTGGPKPPESTLPPIDLRDPE